ncbi:MAG: RHS repeat-associated core domain-containing protein [Bacteroidota bacterium]
MTNNAVTSDILQENHYYPFGLGFEGPWLMDDAGRESQYRYNGKELNEDFGLNWLDYGARWYDAAIGRWNAVDPLADQYISFTPYGYTANNPVKFIDPDGMRIEYSENMSKEDKKELKRHFRELKKNSDTFRAIWKDLKKSKHTHTIHSSTEDFKVSPEDGNYPREGTGSDIYVNPNSNPEEMPQQVALAHEVGHAWRMGAGRSVWRRGNSNKLCF